MKPEYIIGTIVLIILIAGGVLFLTGENTVLNKSENYEEFPYMELVNPTGFVNTDGVALKDLVGEKVILVDFMTYSCINCQRTYPFLIAWYEKYKDQGLEIVGVHTPEFAFEKDIDNVRNAMEEFGIKFPIALDNDYKTWRAWGNRFWPRKYLIDIHGNVVYDHIGEGAYDETERRIQELLEERDEVLGVDDASGRSLASNEVEGERSVARSPEVYFGSHRNEFLVNGVAGKSGTESFALPENFALDGLYLGGTWNIEDEYSKSVLNSEVVYRYNAKKVFMVARSDDPVDIEVWQDDEFVKEITVQESRLYTLIENNRAGEHKLNLKIKGSGLEMYTFTFG